MFEVLLFMARGSPSKQGVLLLEVDFYWRIYRILHTALKLFKAKFSIEYLEIWSIKFSAQRRFSASHSTGKFRASPGIVFDVCV